MDGRDMPGTQAPAAAFALGPVLSARLDEALRSSLHEPGAGERLLRGALEDTAVHAVVFTLRVQGPPAAHVVQLLRASDPLAQWAGLSCI
jgi:hypothetical protein